MFKKSTDWNYKWPAMVVMYRNMVHKSRQIRRTIVVAKKLNFTATNPKQCEEIVFEMKILQCGSTVYAQCAAVEQRNKRRLESWMYQNYDKGQSTREQYPTAPTFPEGRNFCSTNAKSREERGKKGNSPTEVKRREEEGREIQRNRAAEGQRCHHCRRQSAGHAEGQRRARVPPPPSVPPAQAVCCHTHRDARALPGCLPLHLLPPLSLRRCLGAPPARFLCSWWESSLPFPHVGSHVRLSLSLFSSWWLPLLCLLFHVSQSAFLVLCACDSPLTSVRAPAFRRLGRAPCLKEPRFPLLRRRWSPLKLLCLRCPTWWFHRKSWVLVGLTARRFLNLWEGVAAWSASPVSVLDTKVWSLEIPFWNLCGSSFCDSTTVLIGPLSTISVAGFVILVSNYTFFWVPSIFPSVLDFVS